MRPRGSPSAGPTAGVLRVALVLVLLALAAHGIAGREGLDWEALPEAPGSPLAAGLLLLLLAGVLFSVARALARLLRSAPGGAAGPAPAARRLTWQSLLALVVVLVLLVVVLGLVLSAARDFRPDLGEAPTLGSGGAPGDAQTATTPLVTVTVLAVTLGTLAVLLLVALRVVGRRGTERLDDVPQESDEEPAPRMLAAAVAAAEQELVLGDEDRSAIVAAYHAMERHLAAAGTSRSRAETPTELLDRAVAAGHAPARPARTLTDLFRAARFSTGPLPTGSRGEAQQALAEVAAGLRVRSG